MEAPNLIPEEEWLSRYNKLISESSKEVIFNAEVRREWCPINNEAAKELFRLWNDKYIPFETNSNCGSCQRRVFNKLWTKNLI